jgi:hypothetical protein
LRANRVEKSKRLISLISLSAHFYLAKKRWETIDADPNRNEDWALLLIKLTNAFET